MFSQLRTLNKKDHTPPSFVLEAGEQVLFVEDLFSDLGLVNPRGRTLVVRNVGMKAGSPEDRGELYLENFVGDWTFGKGQRVWARQLNTETEGTHLVNAGAELWILGLKTERGGILIDTTQGGKTEVLGGLCYTTTKGKLGPMFRVMEGELSVTLGEVCYTGDPYRTLVEWQENGTPKTLLRGDALLRASFLQGSCLPLVRVKSQATR
jgi:hypothetical protein